MINMIIGGVIMEKATVFDYAKWFLENNLDTPRNTFKGNMKLQKLLFFLVQYFVIH